MREVYCGTPSTNFLYMPLLLVQVGAEQHDVAHFTLF